VASRVRAAFSAAGLRLDDQVCRVNRTGYVGCFLVAAKFRSRDGTDHITAFAVLHRVSATRTDVNINVTADTL
jgi:hypothetical protein